jgi:hypothetical protein
MGSAKYSLGQHDISVSTDLCLNCGLSGVQIMKSRSGYSCTNSVVIGGTLQKPSPPTTPVPPQPAINNTWSVSSPNTPGNSNTITAKDLSELEIGATALTEQGFVVEITAKQTIGAFVNGAFQTAVQYWARLKAVPGSVSQIYRREELSLMVDVPRARADVCECGAEKVNSVHHSKWCAKHREIA